jgi:hypothetical protein
MIEKDSDTGKCTSWCSPILQHTIIIIKLINGLKSVNLDAYLHLKLTATDGGGQVVTCHICGISHCYVNLSKMSCRNICNVFATPSGIKREIEESMIVILWISKSYFFLPLSGVGTTCFSSCCDKDSAIVFTTGRGRLPDVNPHWNSTYKFWSPIRWLTYKNVA